MIIEKGEITVNESIAQELWMMEMNAPGIVGAYRGCGQFINILGSDQWEHPLRRPMSIAGVNDSRLQIIYKPVGPITTLLSTKTVGTTVDVLGPLGNQFTGWRDGNNYPILIGGGTGVAPILNLHHECQQAGVNHTTIFGARNSGGHFLKPDERHGMILTTDDGSLGIRGTVMVPLEQVVQRHPNSVIYACGPEPMLIRVQEFALKRTIPAQLSVESYMACGIGLCQGCVIEKNQKPSRRHTYNGTYSLTCIEGPVYRAEEIRFA